MPLPAFFDRVILLVLCRHDFIQVDFVVEEVVILETSEWLEHLFDLSAQILYQGLVFDAQLILLQTLTFLSHS